MDKQKYVDGLVEIFKRDLQRAIDDDKDIEYSVYSPKHPVYDERGEIHFESDNYRKIVVTIRGKAGDIHDKR